MNDEGDLAVASGAPPACDHDVGVGKRGPSASELLQTDGALLHRGHLAELGLPRRAIDEVFAVLPVVVLPGFSRPFVRAEEYRRLVERSTYRQDQVRPTRRRRSVRRAV